MLNTHVKLKRSVALLVALALVAHSLVLRRRRSETGPSAAADASGRSSDTQGARILEEGPAGRRRLALGRVRTRHVDHLAGGHGVSRRRACAGRAGALSRVNRKRYSIRSRPPATEWTAGLADEPRADVLPRHQHPDARRGRRHDARSHAGEPRSGRTRACSQADPGQPRTLPRSADHAGGWRYQPSSNDSDISVTGWQLMALRAAKAAGCEVPSSSIDRAIAYLKRCAVKQGGGFGYQPSGGPNNARTGTGILALEICGEHLNCRGPCRRRVPAQAPAELVRAVLLLRGLLLPNRHVSVGRQVLPSLLLQARRNPARTPASRRELALRRWQRTNGRTQLLHRHGGAGADRGISVFAYLSAMTSLRDAA